MTLQQVTQLIIAIVGQHTDSPVAKIEAEAPADTPLTNYGIDSMDLVEIAMQIEDDFHFEFLIEDLQALGPLTIDNIAQAVYSRLPVPTTNGATHQKDQPMELKFKKLHPDAITPEYQSDGAACFDLHALMPGEGSNAHVNVGTAVVLRTGLAFEIPEGHVMLVYSWSSQGFKNNVRLANCVGVIDSDYRGEVFVKLTRDEHDGGEVVVKHGHRVAQALIVPIPKVKLVHVEELSSTVRGDNGCGSTGK